MSVNFYMDESVPVAVATGLTRRGIEAVSARDSGNLGLSDEEQLTYASTNEMVVFTHDTDFIQIAHQLVEAGEHHGGVVYVHQSKLTIGECIRRLKELSDLCEKEELSDRVEFL